MSEKAKKFAPWILGVVMLIIGFVYTGVVTSFRDAQLDEQTAIIAQLELDKKNAEANTEGQENEVISDATGLDFNRVAQDDQKARSFIAVATTWDDCESYNNARQELISDYGIKEDSGLLTHYMPLVEDFPGGAGGSMINQIDASGANMTFDSMTSYVTKIDSGVYSYFATVKLSGSNSKGKMASGTSVFTYDIDVDGNVINVNAYTIG